MDLIVRCPCLVPASYRIVGSEEVAQSRPELLIHATAQVLSALNPLQVEVISLIRAKISSVVQLISLTRSSF